MTSVISSLSKADLLAKRVELSNNLHRLELQKETLEFEISDVEDDLEEIDEQLGSVGETFEDPNRYFRAGQIKAAEAMGYKTDGRYVYPVKLEAAKSA